MTKPFSISELAKLERAMTPGDWQWFGNTKMHEVYLATVHGGRIFVMDFQRWGMGGAQPRFQVRADGDPPGAGFMRSLGELGKEEHPLGPRFEVPYRRQFVGIGHPDADGMVRMRNAAPALIAIAQAAQTYCALDLFTDPGNTGPRYQAQDALRTAVNGVQP